MNIASRRRRRFMDVEAMRRRGLLCRQHDQILCPGSGCVSPTNGGHRHEPERVCNSYSSYCIGSRYGVVHFGAGNGFRRATFVEPDTAGGVAVRAGARWSGCFGQGDEARLGEVAEHSPQ